MTLQKSNAKLVVDMECEMGTKLAAESSVGVKEWFDMGT